MIGTQNPLRVLSYLPELTLQRDAWLLVVTLVIHQVLAFLFP